MNTHLLSRRLCLTLAALLCAACAAQWVPTSKAPESEGPSHTLAFQRKLLNPKNGGQLVGQDSLQPGDIILSASAGVTSVGIRVFSLSPVSHAAIYVGDGQIVEAVGSGVKIRRLDDSLDDEAVVVAFRHPQLDTAQRDRIRSFSLEQVGGRYNHVGVMMQAPFMLQRRVCELPVVPTLVRDFCISGLASIQLGFSDDERFFCSQLVVEAYRRANAPITEADPRWISPADLLHMREGDIPSIKARQPLMYVGHLKYREFDLLSATGK